VDQLSPVKSDTPDRGRVPFVVENRRWFPRWGDAGTSAVRMITDERNHR
jgi:hypothetical protein